jgi:Cytochrome C oxidase, cbb3-type, subunit III
MSRRWKIGFAVLLLIPILALATGTAVIYRMLGSDYASRFVIGAVMGTRARPLTNRQFERTPTRVERGRYLVEAARCFTCHSETDSQTDLPLPGTMGAGTVRQLLTPTTYPNITPDWETGAGSWTDDMLARAIREGVGHDGRALIPIMPYANFRYISDDDLESIVVYLRSIPPVHHALPKMKLPILLKLTAAGFPQPLRSPVPQPNASDPAKLGEYLTHIGMCANCHDGQDKEGHNLPYAGGSMIPGPDEKARVAAANLTPDPSGISYYDEALFIRTMRTGHVGARELDAAMPWRYFRNLNDDNLKYIFAYLRNLKPIRHRVDNTDPPSYCKVCGRWHGGGETN